MGTISDKLAYLQETKELIRQAIVSKGQSVSTTASFRSYANKIKAITTSVTHSPSISVSTAGVITATCGGESETKQLATQVAKTVTPGTSSQIAVSSGVYTTGTVTVAGDSELVASNIRKGISIFNVTGTLNATPIVETGCATWSYVSGSAGIPALTFNVQNSIGTVCGFHVYLTYPDENRNLMFCYDAGSGQAKLYCPMSETFMSWGSASISVSGKKISVPIDNPDPVLQRSYSVQESSVSYIPA